VAITTRRDNIICVRRLRQITALRARLFASDCFRSVATVLPSPGKAMKRRRGKNYKLASAAGNMPPGSTTYQTQAPEGETNRTARRWMVGRTQAYRNAAGCQRAARRMARTIRPEAIRLRCAMLRTAIRCGGRIIGRRRNGANSS
jgi:hypothetical protein